MSRQNRIKLIRAIEKKRNSRVIAYITSDRNGSSAQISGDAIRPFYDHVRNFNDSVERIDLFLYSLGGAVDVPWRLVTTLREYCKEFNVLVPFHAHSAATMISLGADHIVIGKKGELGPIDPILTRQEQQTANADHISTEDIMAFIAFLKERAGLGDQNALSSQLCILTEKLTPWTLGEIYRIHSHTRMIARKLITSRREVPEEQVINSIIETLAEKMYFHGHAIGRKEARQIGLPVQEPAPDVEDLMWKLLEEYEHLMQIRTPLDPLTFIPEGQSDHSESTVMACIESVRRLDVFRGTITFQQVRQVPPQLNMNLNFNLALPPNIQPDDIPPQLNQIIQQLLQNLQAQATQIIQDELNKQAPVQRVEGSLKSAKWIEATTEEI